MKQILMLLAVTLCVFGLSYTAKAQTADRSIVNTYATGVDRAAAHAARDFWKRHGELHNEQWFRLQVGFVAEFREAGIKNKIVYDRKGNWLYSIREYGEKELPEETRTLVKSTWFDYSIVWVKEIHQGADLVYVMHLEGEGRWKELAVQEGEMRVLQDVAK